MKKLSRKETKLLKKLWITSAILKSIKQKQKLYKTHLINGNHEQKQYYKKFSNKLTRLKYLSKQNYFKVELENKKTMHIILGG